jgi:uncharacterized protein (DUF1499 family)
MKIWITAIFTMTMLGGCSLIHAWESTVGPSEATYSESRLVDCPDEPNCVSTHAARNEQSIVPFTFSKPLEEARTALKGEMAHLPNTTLRKEDGLYLHFECRTAVLQLADDVEFLFNEESKTLQFRSASRFGFSDWGSNRKRMEELRNKILGRI